MISKMLNVSRHAKNTQQLTSLNSHCGLISFERVGAFKMMHLGRSLYDLSRGISIFVWALVAVGEGTVSFCCQIAIQTTTDGSA